MGLSFIGVDWGTTTVRAFGFDDHGAVVKTVSSRDGVSRQLSGPAGYQRTLEELIGDWAHPSTPVLACGMVGSNRGWAEIPYRSTPTDLITALEPVRVATADRPVFIVPGVQSTAAPYSVMRGEETQALACADGRERLVVTPGTHSKWITLEGLSIASFTTFMTGDTFAALAGHTILSQSTSGSVTESGLRQGLALAFSEHSEGALSDAFAVRSLRLKGVLRPEDGRGFLSGVLIGEEVKHGLAFATRGTPIDVCCDGPLASQYRLAFEMAGVDEPTIRSDASQTGLLTIFTKYLSS